MDQPTLFAWEERIARHVRLNAAADVAHDLGHVERVVRNARRLGVREGADLAVVIPAAWLHDIVAVRKDSPDRARASGLAAAEAGRILRGLGYPAELGEPIAHAIEAHSFSAKIEPRTLEAKVVQDADRLEALGAIGIARCFATSGAMGRPLVSAEDPFATARVPDDRQYALDHFVLKLFRVAESLRTEAGRAEGRRRSEFLHAYWAELRAELEDGEA
jgi:uncharacterized protein